MIKFPAIHSVDDLETFEQSFSISFDAMELRGAIFHISDAYRTLANSTGEEFLEFKEALSDLRSLRQEHRDLTGGGPGWNTRWEAAWAKADELFADEDEAAYMRRPQMSGKDWLAWFVVQPQAFCEPCRHFNEVNPAPWWRGNCRHARAQNDERPRSA